VKVQLDTHVWIWWLLGSERLPVSERRALDRLAGDGGCHLAPMSLWEAQMLHAKGRLTEGSLADPHGGRPSR
jgi:PIN domain nuclease of toxin-antitoxin system